MNYLKRLSKVQELIPSLHADAVLIEHPMDLLYLTGLELSLGRLIVTEEKAELIVDGRYFEVCKKNSPCPVLPLEDFPLKQWLSDNASVKTVAFDSSKTSYQEYLQLENLISVIPVDAPVDQLRLIKDNEEIDLLREAAKFGCEGFQWISLKLQEGITESELALELEIFWRKRGAQKLAFEPIIAFGANSSMPHYHAGVARLQNNSSVLIDIGVTRKYYHSDMTRVLFYGEPKAKIKEIYAIVDEAKNRALELCKPGTPIGDLDAAARGYITSKGYGEHFNHSLGHGIGLDVHEVPRIRSQGPYSDRPLEAGMVITIEPGIYLPGIGGVRLEDTIVINQSGYENLTQQFL